MSKYDCSKTLDYFHELVRRCNDITNVNLDPEVVGCTLSGCSLAGEITQEQINELQKWSDEHPEKTRKEAFREIFPLMTYFSPHYFCFNHLIGAEKNLLECGEIGCEMCWDKSYNGEFEKAREENENNIEG